MPIEPCKRPPAKAAGFPEPCITWCLDHHKADLQDRLLHPQMRTFYEGPLGVGFDDTSGAIPDNGISTFQTARPGLCAERRRPNPDGGSYHGRARISVSFSFERMSTQPQVARANPLG
jgi:hypothetical protein